VVWSGLVRWGLARQMILYHLSLSKELDELMGQAVVGWGVVRYAEVGQGEARISYYCFISQSRRGWVWSGAVGWGRVWQGEDFLNNRRNIL
jgi:hypothetical protein